MEMFIGQDIGTKHLPSLRPRPKLVILEQPNNARFRYKREGRLSDPILGQFSTKDTKTYPTVKITGYVGKAYVVASCVTEYEPYYPHPHNIVGKDGCEKGECKRRVPLDTMTLSFKNIGIQCVKKSEIVESLEIKEARNSDPFRTGFGHKLSINEIDLNCVRLSFQAFIEDKESKIMIALKPVVSRPIHHTKSKIELSIVQLSDCNCPVNGGTKDIMMFCDRVEKGNIKIRFFEVKNGEVVWEAFGKFQPHQIHKNCGISFRPPPYKDLTINEPVSVFMQLKRPSDDKAGEALPFQYLPIESKYVPVIKKEKNNDYKLSKELEDTFLHLSSTSTSGKFLNVIDAKDIEATLPLPEHEVLTTAQLSSSDLTMISDIENNSSLLKMLSL